MHDYHGETVRDDDYSALKLLRKYWYYTLGQLVHPTRIFPSSPSSCRAGRQLELVCTTRPVGKTEAGMGQGFDSFNFGKTPAGM